MNGHHLGGVYTVGKLPDEWGQQRQFALTFCAPTCAYIKNPTLLMQNIEKASENDVLGNKGSIEERFEPAGA
jgi:hypothetical protein